MNDLQIDKNGQRFLELIEGRSNKSYRDSRGYWTTGVGHLVNLHTEKYLVGSIITDAKIDQIFQQDCAPREKWLNINCNWQDPMRQYEFNALMSFTWQYHIDNPKYANTKAAIISGDRAKIVKQIMQFVNSEAGNGDNQMLPRRKQEIALFTKGQYPFKVQ